jgi:hypothetical protein
MMSTRLLLSFKKETASPNLQSYYSDHIIRDGGGWTFYKKKFNGLHTFFFEVCFQIESCLNIQIFENSLGSSPLKKGVWQFPERVIVLFCRSISIMKYLSHAQKFDGS